jgi:hypothetical protein
VGEGGQVAFDGVELGIAADSLRFDGVSRAQRGVLRTLKSEAQTLDSGAGTRRGI